MRKIRLSLRTALILIVVVTVFYNIGKAEEDLKYIDIFSSQNPDVSGWHDNWNGVPSGTIITQEDKKAIVIGTHENKSYGLVYRNIEIDLDKFPILEMEISSVTHHWYIIFSGSNFKEGYIKIQPDTNFSGEKKYDLRLLTGLSGKQTFEFQLGVSTADMKNSIVGEKLIFTKLRFSRIHEEKDGKIIVSDSSHPDLGGWINEWPDGRNTGAIIYSSGNLLVVQGMLDTQSYGCLYRDINLDLDKFPFLKINVASVSHHWYSIIISPKLEGGFVRIQPDTDATGEFIYDLRDISGLAGSQTFQLQVGVSTAEEKPSIKRESMSFSNLAFLSQDEKTAKIALKKKDIIFSEVIAAPIEKEIEKLTLPTSIFLESNTVNTLPIIIREITIFPDELDSELDCDIFSPYLIAQEKIKQPSVSRLSFTDKDEKEIVISNAYYGLGISKSNGAITYIKNMKTGHNLSLGSSEGCLWSSTLFKEGEYFNIKGNEFSPVSLSMNFEYRWLETKKTLQLTYHMVGKRSLDVIINVIGSSENFFDLQVEVFNKSEDINVSFALPWNLTFDYHKLERFIFPHKIGVAFNKNFFLSKKRWSEEYPPAFCDFVALESDLGNLAIYMVNTDDLFQPVILTVGHSKNAEDRGIYQHKFATYIQSNEKWKSPLLRFRFFPSLDSAVTHFQSDNKLNKSPRLKNKLGSRLFKKLSKSILIKLDVWGNKNFKHINDFLTELPNPSLVHLTSFWPEGFDRYYPDYLPPNPLFGSSQDFKDLINSIHEKGLLVMPYTNPTWWNMGPTLKSLSENEIGVRKLDDSLDYEKYNLNGGYVISPYHPKVLKRLAQTLREFSLTYPMDLIFEDQIGVRRWRYDLNPSAKNPILYTQGLIDIIMRDSKKIPVMTEGGFDKLTPYTAGFCGLTSMTIPTFKGFDKLWGQGNWELYPLAIYLAHPYVAFYQHNLANEVFTDSKAKLTWNLTYGYNLSQGKWIVQWERQKPWMWIADAFQKSVASRCFGKNLTKFIKINKDVILSQFEDINILGNFSRNNTFSFDNYTIAKEGFLAMNKDKSLIAGIFTVFNGLTLWNEHFLIVEKNKDAITVHQPLSKSSLITISRPETWINEDWIQVYRQLPNSQEQVISSVSPKDITFLYEVSPENGSYLINYKKSSLSDKVKLILFLTTPQAKISAGEKVKVTLIAQNKTKKYLDNSVFALTGWVIKSYNSLPESESGYKDSNFESTQTRELFDPLGPGDEAVCEFEINVPEEVSTKDVIWLKAEFIYSYNSSKLIKAVHKKINLSD